MARKPNYQFEKRQKELDRKARKEEKLRRRQERATDGDPADPAGAGQPTDGTDVSERPGGSNPPR
jgi:hypothetical protein